MDTVLAFLEVLVDSIYDAVEEFFNALVIPTKKLTRDAFLVSLAFIGLAFLCKWRNWVSFVSIEEAITCSIVLLIIVLVDTSTKDAVKRVVKRVKTIDVKSKLEEMVYSEEGEEDDE